MSMRCSKVEPAGLDVRNSVPMLPPSLKPRRTDKHRSGPSGRSGQHQAQRRPLAAAAEQWKRWDRAASRAGVSWAVWVRDLQDRALARQLPSKELGGPFAVRRLLSASPAQWRAWSLRARDDGASWAQWVRGLQDAAANE